MNLEHIILGEIIQSQKDKCCFDSTYVRYLDIKSKKQKIE